MPNARVRWAAYAVILALTAGLLSAAVCRVKPLLSANDRSRWCTVWSLVERGTFDIDEIDAVDGWSTIDKVRHRDHFYSSKPPLLSTIAAGVYWVVKAVTGWNLNEHTDEAARTILFIVNVIPMLVCVAVMVLFVERYARTDFARIVIVAAFALATFLTTFSVTLNNHTVAALAVVLATYAGCRVVVDGSNCPGLLTMAGFFASFAAVNELPAAAFAAAVFALLLWRAPAGTLKWAIPAGLIPVAAFFVTSYLATGDWKPFYAYYGTEKYKYIVDGVPSYWLRPAGLDANVESPFVYFLNCTIGHHGIFSLSPIFLLALAAWCVPRLSRGSLLRTWLWLSGGLTAIVVAFYLTRTQNYNYGGNTAGLRWTFWLIPLWIVSTIPALDACGQRRIFRWLASVLLAITAFSSWYAIDNPWQHPWLYRFMERWHWIDYARRPAEFTRPVTTFFPLLPRDEKSKEWIEFAAVEPTGAPTRLRLSDLGTVEQSGHRLRKLDATWHPGGPGEKTLSLLIDPAAFDAGEPPAKFLVDSGATRDTAARQAVEAFLQGLPSPRAYRRGTVRYLKTPLRNDAFECRLAAAQVVNEDAKTDRSERHRIDVWLTSAVPFGVLQFDQTVRDADSDELLAYRRFAAVATSRSFAGKENEVPAKATDASPALNIPPE